MIRLDDVTIRLGDLHLDQVSLEVPTGSYAVLMGRSGSGKSTLLEAIAGLRPVVSGRIVLGDRDVTGLKPALRDIGYVPQDGALFSTMTVRDHLAFALAVRRVAAAVIAARVAEYAALLEIEHLLDRTPHGLSGGEKQRVAIGRAISFGPPILLLDEPLSALDEQTRRQMHVLLAHVRKHTGVTTMHVTHNREDAEHLADQALLIDEGRVRAGPPL